MRTTTLIQQLPADHPVQVLTTEQAQALQEWITHYPRAWKQELSDAWMRAGERVPYYSPALQQIRNACGGELIQKITASDVSALLAQRARRSEVASTAAAEA